MLKQLIFCGGLAFIIQGCAAETWYNLAQGARLNQCDKLADSAERTRCLENASKHYDQYTRDQQDKH